MSEQVIEKWDNGEIIPTIEMGGISPSYEQVIQITAIEMLRDLLAFGFESAKASDKYYNKHWKKIKESCEATSKRIGYLQLSGAQFGAALNLATRGLIHGWDGMIEDAKKQGLPQDRFIQTSRSFPQAPNKPQPRQKEMNESAL